MVKKKEVSKDEKLKIHMWTEAGIKTAEIAARLGRGESNIRRLRAELGKLPPPRRPVSGRPRSTTHAEDERLKRYVEKFPSKTAKELIQEVKGFEQQSARFVQDRLKRVLKIPSRRAAKKPLLTKKMKKKRLDFAKKYISWTESDWARHVQR